MSDATETGDRELWPRILRHYQEHPGLRRVTLWHIPFYWKEHTDLVVPLVREALRDPQLLDVALPAAAAFPELADELHSCVRAALRDPKGFDEAVAQASQRPELRDTVVVCLAESDLTAKAGSEEIVGALAELLGLNTSATEFVYYARSVQQGILDQVEAELRQHYGIELELGLSEP